MSFPEWEPPESWWVVVAGSITFRVDAATAHRLSDEYDRGDRMLIFTDLTGGQCRASATEFTAFESTPDIREKDRVLGRIVDREQDDYA